ncbi:sulfate permease family protein [Aphelenchoides avenae]|nr:sulfate permease family protein [Aphelenchus avenae]
MAGAKTQLNALFTTTLLFIVIAALGPLLEPLPMAVLACIVMVSLKSLFLQVTELPRLWTISKFDFAVWIVSCVSTICTDVQNGLMISVVFILVTVVLREQWPRIARLGMSNDGQIFKSVDRYEGLHLPNNGTTVILKFEAPLHFANVANFREEVNKQLSALSSSPEGIATARNGKNGHAHGNGKPVDGDTSFDALLSPPHSPSPDPSGSENKSRSSSVNGTLTLKVSFAAKPTLIVDCSAMAYLDSMGIEALKESHKEGASCDVRVSFAGVSDSILATLEACKFFGTTPKQSFFPSVRDAVLAATDV